MSGQNSFYGGKQGRTYNLVAHYDNVHQMVTLFQKGGSYNDVNYNEYVIIDTIVNNNQRYHRENGLLYRRGMAYSVDFNPNGVPLNENYSLTDYDFTTEELEVYCTEEQLGTWLQDNRVPPNDDGVVVCVAKTRLPRFRHFESMIVADPDADTGYSISGFHQKDLYTKEEADALPEQFYHYKTEWMNFVTEPGGGAEYVGQIVGPKGDATQIEVVNWLDFEESLDHPGTYDKAGEVHASRRPGVDEEAGVLSYYDDIEFGYCNIIDSDGNITNALVSFNIPYTVIQTNTISVSPYGPTIIDIASEAELPTSKPDDARVIYHIEDSERYYIWDDNRVEPVDVEGYPNQYEKVPGFVLTAPWTATQDTTKPHVWKQEGLVRERPDSIGHLFFKDLEINVPNGLHGDDFKGFNIYSSTLPDPERDEDETSAFGRENHYHLYAYYQNYDNSEDGDELKRDLGKLQVIDYADFPIVSDGSFLNLHYYNDVVDRLPMPRLAGVRFDTTTGIVTVNILTGNATSSIDLAPIKYVSKLEKDNDLQLDGEKRYRAYYNTGDEQEDAQHRILPVSDKVNEVVTMRLYGDNLIVLYSDPSYRYNEVYEGGQGSYVLLPYEEDTWTVGTGDVAGDPPKYYWKNLGPIFGGEHVFGRYATLAALQAAYPYGFDRDQSGQLVPSMEKYAGWVASIVTMDPEHLDRVKNTALYAYDYSSNNFGWYEISSVASNEIDPRATMIVSDDQGTPGNPIPETGGGFLNKNGYWFVTSTIEVATDN